jgi:hypothetical protein
MTSPSPALSPAQVEAFIEDGFVRLDHAFQSELARAALPILWGATGCDPNDPATWTKPVVRLSGFADPPFREAANTPLLRSAFNQLVGEGRWVPRGGLGSFPVRFPSPEAPGDDGWHVDASFGTENPDFFEWRVNVHSQGRALLMLFLFSDVGEEDAPTRIRIGSHRDVARYLAPHGDAGRSLRQFLNDGFDWSADRPETLATGPAGTVYLCHPFLVHAAQPHRGSRVKFMAQPPLLPSAPLQIDRRDANYTPVELAIRIALDEQP